ncbi:BA14K family protein [Brevundimonas sp. FT23042]|uniref:BA14K family protein n=1 Tax=Brevundimonas sp. FT23042 TaxID=3393749 RepID=UPI003B5873F0
MRAPALLLVAALAMPATLIATTATAQSWQDGYGYEYGRSGYSAHEPDGGRYYTPRYSSNAVPSRFDWRSQLDRPGDYRCDRFWDASRDDCGDRWRDQRHRVSAEARSEYRALAGYGRGDGYGYQGYRYSGYGYGYGGYGHGPRRGYGSQTGYGYGYGHSAGGTTYQGAYGRPDVVFPGGGSAHSGYAGGGRDARRIDWCRATYRSYDPHSGYYRAFSGRLVWCG